MAIDSRAKGRTAEIQLRDKLRKLTGLQWERTPLSGALSANHMLKGDVYVPEAKMVFCVECKHYKDDHINTKLLTGKSPQFMEWWAQAVREAEQMKKEPLLIFKHNRSKWFAAFTCIDIAVEVPDSGIKHLVVSTGNEEIYVMLLDDFADFVGEWIE